MSKAYRNRYLEEELRYMGFGTVNLWSRPFQNIRLEWDVDRTGKSIDLDLSDYYTEMDPKVAGDLLLTDLLRGATGSQDTYEPESVAAINSFFTYERQKRHIDRTTGLTHDTDGTYHNLSTAYGKLVESGLLADCPQLYMSWMQPYRKECLADGHFHTIFVPGVLDSHDVSAETIEYIVFKLVTEATTPYRSDPSERKAEIEERLKALSPTERVMRELDARVIW